MGKTYRKSGDPDDYYEAQRIARENAKRHRKKNKRNFDNFERDSGEDEQDPGKGQW